jgi:TonB-linked SusC/RagA family outer membrane protein
MQTVNPKRLFKLHKLSVTIVFQLLVIAVCAQVRINGKVTDADGKPVPYSSVSVKNTTYGTSANETGDYTLTANLKPGNYTLVFSALNFATAERSVQVASATGSYTVNSQMAVGNDPLKLDEVVVTGVSAGMTRKQIGSYISTVRAEELTKGATGNVLAALQGKTAGAQIIQNSGDPAGGISVRLRGISSINSSSEPLYIVDGVIVNNATNRVTNTQSGYDGTGFVGTIGQNRMVDINPADIDRIEVLNGAAAAAIYGSRANAGVVQIFTKRGQSGAPQINFSTSFMVSELRKKLDVNQAPVKFGGSIDVFTQDIISTVPNPPGLPILPTNTTPVNRYDYQDYIFRTAIGSDNNISVSGGTDKTKYYLSGSYFTNQGIVQNTNFQRYSFRANVEQTLSKVFSASMGLNYINSSANEKPDGNSFFSPINSINIIGNFHDIFARDAAGNLKAVGERGRVNPVSIIEDFKQRQETNRVLASLGLKARAATGLTFDYTLGIDNYTQTGTTYMPPFAYNVSTAFWGGAAALDPTLNGYASAGNNSFFQINNEINGTYQFNISSSLNSTTQVGYSLQYEKNKYNLLQGRGASPFIETVAGASTPLQTVDSRSEQSVWGSYIQQNFKWRNRLFVTAALRLDGSSVFGKDERNQLYKKASVSYLLSESETWRNKMPWWNTFKLRAAYGESGNLTGIGAYQRFTVYTGLGYLSRTALTTSTERANENVKPERQNELEIGADLSFLNNRIGLTVNWYNKRVDDLLFPRVIAPTTGFTSLLDNFGKLENKGIEVVVTGSPVRKKNFDWNVTAIFNRNRNKVVEIGPALSLVSTNAGAPVALLEGYPVGIFYGSFFARDANGSQIKNSGGLLFTEKGVQTSPTSYTTQRDANGLPVITATTLRRVLGDPNPDWTGSLTNELTFKKFNLRVQLDAVQGVDVWNADWRTRQGVGSGKEAEKEHLGIYPRGYINSAYQIEEWRIDDGSFVKLREVSLSYNLGKIKSLRDLTLSVSGRNLISWDNYKGYDPEVNAAGQSTVLRGIDFGAVPIPRTFSVGLSVKL